MLVDMNKPKISVLMSCYNSEKYLQYAIKSVLQQDFKDFEFIIVDDGSIDDTKNIINNFKEIDNRIIALFKHHSGLADSLNYGLKWAKGDWIARLDSDDICESNRLSEQLNYVSKHNGIVLLGSAFSEINDFGFSIKKQNYPENHKSLFNNLIKGKRFFPHSSAFIHKETLLKDPYNPFFKKSQDKDLWLRISKFGKFACIQNSLVKIRKHNKQISNSLLGYSQLTYSIAASTCFFINNFGHDDPSRYDNELLWDTFIKWINEQVMNDGFFNRMNLWSYIRNEYLNKRKISVLKSLLYSIIKNNNYRKLFLFKLFGTNLPKKLAYKWINLNKKEQQIIINQKL